MAEYSYLVKLPGALLLRIQVPGPLFTDEAARILLAAYLPGAEFLDASVQPALELRQWTVRFVQSAQTSLSLDSESGIVTFSDNSTGEGALMDLLFLSYGVARQHWLGVGLYPVHAACLENAGLHLIAGHSGVGKTAVTLSQVARGWKVFSGNKTLVKIEDGAITAVAGTRPITTKAEDAARHLPAASLKTGYQGRSAFYLADKCYADAQLQAVKRIVLPRLNDGVEKAGKLGNLSALHKLYPYFLDAVNADIILSGGKAVFCGSPADGVQERLASGLSAALVHVPVYEVEGSLAFINQTLEGL